MNAVMREVISYNGPVKGLTLSFVLPELRVLILVFLLLISALGVIYVKDLNRRLFISYHKLQVQGEQLESDGNKLLLLHSAWGSQSRVQTVAEKQLGMRIPQSADVQMIKV